MTGANDKTGVGAGSGEWETPPGLFERLNRIYAFDIDLFASHQNRLCDWWCTAEGVYFEDGGVNQRSGLEGHGFTYSPRDTNDPRRGFGNPMFSTMEEFAASYIARRNAFDVLVGLVPASVETQWYRDLERHATIFVLPFRIQFVHPPFECGDKCQTGKRPHRLGEVNPGSPGGHAIVQMRPTWMDR